MQMQTNVAKAHELIRRFAVSFAAPDKCLATPNTPSAVKDSLRLDSCRARATAISASPTGTGTMAPTGSGEVEGGGGIRHAPFTDLYVWQVLAASASASVVWDSATILG